MLQQVAGAADTWPRMTPIKKTLPSPPPYDQTAGSFEAKLDTFEPTARAKKRKAPKNLPADALEQTREKLQRCCATLCQKQSPHAALAVVNQASKCLARTADQEERSAIRAKLLSGFSTLAWSSESRLFFELATKQVIHLRDTEILMGCIHILLSRFAEPEISAPKEASFFITFAEVAAANLIRLLRAVPQNCDDPGGVLRVRTNRATNDSATYTQTLVVQSLFDNRFPDLIMTPLLELHKLGYGNPNVILLPLVNYVFRGFNTLQPAGGLSAANPEQFDDLVAAARNKLLATLKGLQAALHTLAAVREKNKTTAEPVEYDPNFVFLREGLEAAVTRAIEAGNPALSGEDEVRYRVWHDIREGILALATQEIENPVQRVFATWALDYLEALRERYVSKLQSPTSDDTGLQLSA